VFGGLQMDEVSFPTLLAGQLGRTGAADWEHIRKAEDFVIANGPSTPGERWENASGYSPATIAAEISGLVVGAGIARKNGDNARADHYLQVADSWRGNLGRWTVTTNGPLSSQPYFLRITADGDANAGTQIQLSDGGPLIDQREVLDPSFLELVRLGVLRPDDPRVLNTLTLVDQYLGYSTPNGPFWHRASFDGYGETADGSEWQPTPTGSGTTHGRGWPLLTGERGHYELCAGRDPLPYLESMTRMASEGGMLPEQIWDAAPISKRGLSPGRPTGAAMPLVWAHAEYLKLAASRLLKRPFDRPEAVWERYHGERPQLTRVVWTERAPVTQMQSGCDLTIALREPGVVRFGFDNWQDAQQMPTTANSLGLHLLKLDTAQLRAGRVVDFTFRQGAQWVGTDFHVLIGAPAAPPG